MGGGSAAWPDRVVDKSERISAEEDGCYLADLNGCAVQHSLAEAGDQEVGLLQPRRDHILCGDQSIGFIGSKFNGHAELTRLRTSAALRVASSGDRVATSTPLNESWSMLSRVCERARGRQEDEREEKGEQPGAHRPLSDRAAAALRNGRRR